MNNENEEEVESEVVNEALLTDQEARVIACLMEKELTTPNNYPLTTNSLMLACNQKSNRDPVMNMTLGQVGQVVNRLRDREFVSSAYAGRAEKISHRSRVKLILDKEQQAVMTVLMLRAPMTVNDILTRTARMVDLIDPGHVQDVLRSLESRNTPLVIMIPASAGRREDRYTHLVCGDIDPSDLPVRTTAVSKSTHSDEMLVRLEQLEERVANLESKVENQSFS